MELSDWRFAYRIVAMLALTAVFALVLRRRTRSRIYVPDAAYHSMSMSAR